MSACSYMFRLLGYHALTRWSPAPGYSLDKWFLSIDLAFAAQFKKKLTALRKRYKTAHGNPHQVATHKIDGFLILFLFLFQREALQNNIRRHDIAIHTSPSNDPDKR